MFGVRTRRCAVGLLLLIPGRPPEPVRAEGDCRPCEETVGRALKLLPRQPERVVVVDMDRSTALLRTKMAHTDAFVTTGLRIVYVRKQGATFQQALKRQAFSDHVLAIVIWHEMAHLDGADEPAAQRAEEDLWSQYVVGRRVPADPGMAYLTLLRQRRE
jgi:hypothetical protein